MRRGSTGPAYLGESKVVSPHMIVGDNTAVKAIAALYDKTPLETLKAWERFKVADQASNYLSKRFVDSKFEYTKTLSGAKELRPRWRRGDRRGRRPARRAARQDLRRPLLPGPVEDDDGRAGRQPEEGRGQAHPGQ